MNMMQMTRTLMMELLHQLFKMPKLMTFSIDIKSILFGVLRANLILP
jgi:hypothetical protein